jgi:type II secretory pathway pseudopilin PulG
MIGHAMWNRRFARGITAIELVVVIVIAIVAVGVLLPYLGRTRCGSRQLRDSTQVRGMHQGLVFWRQSNSDDYPLPSLIDRKNETVAAQDRAKDTTANYHLDPDLLQLLQPRTVRGRGGDEPCDQGA